MEADEVQPRPWHQGGQPLGQVVPIGLTPR